ncbi:MAG: glycerol kinase, partial [Pseudomonadales bacterium 32-61-5]
MTECLLAIDQGTTSSRAILFDRLGHPLATSQQEFTQYFPYDGWVEHDGEQIWQSTLEVCRRVIADSGIGAGQIAGIGITNQRETTLLWDACTGELLHRAIVWQDRRTADFCEQLRRAGHEP